MENPDDNQLLANLLFLSNVEYCQSAEDLQYNLEEINYLIKCYYPDLKEAVDLD